MGAYAQYMCSRGNAYPAWCVPTVMRGRTPLMSSYALLVGAKKNTRPEATTINGAILRDARRDNLANYREVASGSKCSADGALTTSSSRPRGNTQYVFLSYRPVPRCYERAHMRGNNERSPGTLAAATRGRCQGLGVMPHLVSKSLPSRATRYIRRRPSPSPTVNIYKFRLKWVTWGPLRVKADSFVFLPKAHAMKGVANGGGLCSPAASPRDGEPELADPPSPELRSEELAPLPAVAETPADQLGRHRDQDEDDADNPWAGLFRPVALQFDGDEGDEVPHTPAQEEFPAALAANPFDVIGTPPKEDPADERAICQEAIGEHDGWRWPLCHVAHRFHAMCVSPSTGR